MNHRNVRVSGIYQILNRVNGHRYIGSAVDLKKRESQHWRRLRGGKHENRHLQNSWNKHGEDAFVFETIGTCQPDVLVRMEQHLLDDISPEYNISPTAGSQLGIKRTIETRAKIRASKMGRRLTLEHKMKISTANMGNQHRLGQQPTDETRAKLRVARKGRRPYLGHQHTPETRAKMSMTRTGRKHTPETKEKMKAAQKSRGQIVAKLNGV